MQNSLAIISLELGAAILFWLVFVVIETAVLQFLRWDTFQGCLRSSLIANLASGIFIILSFMWIPQGGLIGLLLGVLLAMIIEALVLSWIKPAAHRPAWLASIAANLASFLILMLPVFWIIINQK